MVRYVVRCREEKFLEEKITYYLREKLWSIEDNLGETRRPMFGSRNG